MSFRSIFQFIKLSNSPLISVYCKSFNFPIPEAAKSLAIPLTPRQSPLFGVISISITGSLRSITFVTDKPKSVSSGNSIIPLWFSDIVNSFSEHNIPKDSSPLILPFFKVKLNPGINVPTLAKTPTIPCLTLGAPQTTLYVFCPSNTLQTLSLSAFGCL